MAESLLSAFARVVADHVERRAPVPAEVRPALRHTVECEIRAWLPILSGEKVYVGGLERVVVRRRLTRAEAEERRDRILAALQAGESVTQIARRESVSRRWVTRVRASSRP